MDHEASATFWRRLVGRLKPGAAEDPAAMGTAFGLEASLGPASSLFLADGHAADSRLDPPESPMNWLARRRQRRR